MLPENRGHEFAVRSGEPAFSRCRRAAAASRETAGGKGARLQRLEDGAASETPKACGKRHWWTLSIGGGVRRVARTRHANASWRLAVRSDLAWRGDPETSSAVFLAARSSIAGGVLMSTRESRRARGIVGQVKLLAGSSSRRSSWLGCQENL